MSKILERVGRAVAQLWFGLLGIFLLLSFLVAAIFVSICAGAFAAVASANIGGTVLVMVSFLTVAVFVGLFLSVYVWEPYVKDVTDHLFKTLEESVKNRTR